MLTHWPQYTVLLFLAMGIGFHIALHGQSRTGVFSAWLRLTTAAVWIWLLYEGNFFAGM